MMHRRLSRARSNSALEQQRRECASQSVNVRRLPPLFSLENASRIQITVEDSHQTGGNAKQLSVTGHVRVDGGNQSELGRFDDRRQIRHELVAAILVEQEFECPFRAGFPLLGLIFARLRLFLALVSRIQTAS